MAEGNATVAPVVKNKTSYLCSICDRVFITKRDLLLHQYIHKEKPNFTCQICNKSFPNEPSFKRHARVHTRGKKIITCKICEATFDNGRALEDHHRQNHLDEKKFRCDTCGAEFSWRDNLLKHERMHAEETHKCDICHKGFMDNTSLRVHIRNHHSNVEDPEKPYICGICNKAFKFDFSYEAHLNAHERPANALTGQRAVTSSTKSSTTATPHIGTSNEKEFILKIVNEGEEGATHQYEVKEEHQRSVSGQVDGKQEAEFDSQQTTTIVVNNGASTSHVDSSSTVLEQSLHVAKPGPSGVAKKRKREPEPLMFNFVMSEEKPFSCDVCGQDFRWEISLQIHMKTHEVGYMPPVRGKTKRGMVAPSNSTSPGVHKSSRIVGKRSGSDSEGELDEEFVYVQEDGSRQTPGSHMLVVSAPAGGHTTTIQTVDASSVIEESLVSEGNVITVVPDGTILNEAHLDV